MLVRKMADVTNIEWRGGLKKRLLVGPRDGAPTFLVRSYEVMPGSKGEPLHTHNWEQVGIVLAGKGAILSESGEIKIEAGDVYFEAANEPHGLVNKGADVLRFLYIAPVCAYVASADPSINTSLSK